MPEDREMTPADFQAVTKDCVRRTVNLQDPVPINAKLGDLQIDTDGEIGLLKDLLTGKNNPEIGVTHFLYRLNRDYLRDVGSDTTVLGLATMAKDSSVPDMTSRRALLVISGSASKVTGQTIQPDPNHALSETGIDDTNKLKEFKDRVIGDPAWGVARFRRKLDGKTLDNVGVDTLIGVVVDILRHDSEPDIKEGE